MKIGIDIGGTNIVCGMINDQGQLVGKMKMPTESDQGSDAVFRKVADMAHGLMRRMGVGHSDVEVVGAGIPGLIDPVNGICIGSANLKWRDLNVVKELGKLLDLPIFIGNDVKMYIYGEALYGAGQGYRVVLGVTIGTGIASALVENGRLYYGSQYIAGEMGHVPMEGISNECVCGKTGCLETVLSASGMTKMARENIAKGQKSYLTDMVDNLEDITAAHISQAFDLGDRVAIHIISYSGKLLGKALSNAIALFNPDIVVIGGGVANAGERMLGYARTEIQKSLNPAFWQQLQVTCARMNDDAGVIGSAAYATARLKGEVP